LTLVVPTKGRLLLSNLKKLAAPTGRGKPSEGLGQCEKDVHVENSRATWGHLATEKKYAEGEVPRSCALMMKQSSLPEVHSLNDRAGKKGKIKFKTVQVGSP